MKKRYTINLLISDQEIEEMCNDENHLNACCLGVDIAFELKEAKDAQSNTVSLTTDGQIMASNDILEGIYPRIV